MVEHVQHVPPRQVMNARAAFVSLWMQLNGAESWLANPLVWRVEFEVVKGGVS